MEIGNWEALLRARDHLPGPGMDRDGADALSQQGQDKSAAAHLGLDIDDILEMARERGHGWLP